jgi:hypothetical protein
MYDIKDVQVAIFVTDLDCLVQTACDSQVDLYLRADLSLGKTIQLISSTM